MNKLYKHIAIIAMVTWIAVFVVAFGIGGYYGYQYWVQTGEYIKSMSQFPAYVQGVCETLYYVRICAFYGMVFGFGAWGGSSLFLRLHTSRKVAA